MAPNRKQHKATESLSIDATISVDIEGRKAIAERLLIGAMLREPFNLHQYSFNPIALSNASDNLAPIFDEILKQHAHSGIYSPTTISAATGTDVVYAIASENSDVDLAWAYDHYISTFQTWASIMCLSSALYQVTTGQITDTAVFDSALNHIAIQREQIGASGQNAAEDGKEAFLKQCYDKLEGREPDYKTKPHTESLRYYMPAFKPGYMTVIAARPGMGKTQFVCNLLSHFTDNGAKGAFFSLEMSTADLMSRLIGIRHGINPAGDWSALDQQTVYNAINEVYAMPTNIFEKIFTVENIESASLALHAKGELDYIIVDYMQLAKTARNYGNRNDEVSAISAAFVRMSKRFNVPVIALSQLSRAVEARGGSKRPSLSDLRDSGSIEQDAANVIFLYRPEYYGILEDEQGNDAKGIAEVIIAKQRNGIIGTAFHRWNPIRGYQCQEQKIPPGPSLPNTFESMPYYRPNAEQQIPF